MIPKKLHRLMADLKKFQKDVERYDSMNEEEQRVHWVTASLFETAWQSFTDEERSEAIEFYGKKKEVAPARKQSWEKKFESMTAF